MKSKLTFIFVLIVKPSAVLEVLDQYGYTNSCAPKNDISVSPLSLD